MELAKEGTARSRRCRISVRHQSKITNPNRVHVGGLAHTATTIAASQRRRRRRAAPRSSVTFDAAVRDPRLVRIREEKLVAVEILDDQDPVAPLAFLDRNAAGFELGAQPIALPFSPTSRSTFMRPYDTRDGKRFLITCTVEPPGRFSVLLNWPFSPKDQP